MGDGLKGCPFCGLAPSRAAKPHGTPIVCCGNVHCTLGASEWYEIDEWNQRPIEAAATARAEAAEQRAEALEREVARLHADCAILGGELSEANRLLLSGIPQQRGAAAERAAIACVLTGRAKTLRDRKALGAAEEVEALAFYIEQRGVAAEAQPAGEVSDG